MFLPRDPYDQPLLPFSIDPLRLPPVLSFYYTLPLAGFPSTILHRNNSTLAVPPATASYVTRNNSRTCGPIQKRRRGGIRKPPFPAGGYIGSGAKARRIATLTPGIDLSLAPRCTAPLNPRSIALRREVGNCSVPIQGQLDLLARVIAVDRSICVLPSEPCARRNTVPNRSGNETRSPRRPCFTDYKRKSSLSLFLCLPSQIPFYVLFFFPSNTTDTRCEQLEMRLSTREHGATIPFGSVLCFRLKFKHEFLVFSPMAISIIGIHSRCSKDRTSCSDFNEHEF